MSNPARGPLLGPNKTPPVKTTPIQHERGRVAQFAMIAIICYGVVLFVVCFIAFNAFLAGIFIDALTGSMALEIRIWSAIFAAFFLGLELVPVFAWLHGTQEEQV